MDARSRAIARAEGGSVSVARDISAIEVVWQELPNQTDYVTSTAFKITSPKEL